MSPAKKKRRSSLDRVLALQIARLRTKQGKSQQQLADMLGESQSTITRIESGDRSITVVELFRIAAALDCAPIYLLSGGLTAADVPVTPDEQLPSWEAELWIVGHKMLKGANERAFCLENISAQRASDIEKAARRLGVTDGEWAKLLGEDDDAR